MNTTIFLVVSVILIVVIGLSMKYWETNKLKENLTITVSRTGGANEKNTGKSINKKGDYNPDKFPQAYGTMPHLDECPNNSDICGDGLHDYHHDSVEHHHHDHMHRISQKGCVDNECHKSMMGLIGNMFKGLKGSHVTHTLQVSPKDHVVTHSAAATAAAATHAATAAAATHAAPVAPVAPTKKQITSAADCTAAGGHYYSYCPETGKHYCCGVDPSKGYETCLGTDGKCPSNAGLQDCVCEGATTGSVLAPIAPAPPAPSKPSTTSSSNVALYTSTHPGYYISEYAKGTSQVSSGANTFADAQDLCNKTAGCTGITYSPTFNPKYSVRKGNLEVSSNDEVSWVKTSGPESEASMPYNGDVHPGFYISTYAKGTSQTSSGADTFDAAKTLCDQTDGCTGITYSPTFNPKYSVRKGTLEVSPNKEVSWVKSLASTVQKVILGKHWGSCGTDGKCEPGYECRVSDASKGTAGGRCLTQADCTWAAGVDKTTPMNNCNPIQ